MYPQYHESKVDSETRTKIAVFLAKSRFDGAYSVFLLDPNYTGIVANHIREMFLEIADQLIELMEELGWKREIG